MSKQNLRRSLIRLASTLPKGSSEKRDLLNLLTASEGMPRVALNEETSQFVDWVMLNQDKWSERAMETYLTRLLGRGPSAYVKKTKRGPDLKEGDMVIPKPEKAPPQNQAMAEQFKYEPGTVEKLNSDGVLIRFENGQAVQFFGAKTGTPTGLYRYTPKSTYSDAPSAKKHVEFVYFSKPGEVEPYRKHVVKEYKERGESRGEDRKTPYYSGYIVGFKETKDGNVICTVMTQQRPYPVSISPKKGELLYFGLMRKRPNWKSDFQSDVAELAED